MQIVASECASGLFPKNTLPGFEYCLSAGFDGIEFDVHLSADHHCVVQHDYYLNTNITRNEQGHWLERPTPALVRSDLATLRKFDVGRYRVASSEARAYPDYQAIDGTPIPTLDEFLAAANASSNATSKLWLELKTTPLQRTVSSDPDRLLDVVLQRLSDAGLTRRTVLLAFEWDVLLRARELAPTIETNFLTLSADIMQRLYPRLSARELERIYGAAWPGATANFAQAIAEAGGNWWGPLFSEISIAEVRDAQALGLRVNAWGVGNERQEIQSAIALDADGITTSRPDVARSLLGQHEVNRNDQQ